MNTKKIRAAIRGVEGYVPDYILTNEELSTFVDTNDEWIVSRTGIKERRILKEEGKGTSWMAIKAVTGLIQKTGIDPETIDLLICATTTPDMPFPATANLIALEAGAKNSFSFDMQATCSGFIYALTTGAQFIESGRYKRVVVVAADKMSSMINYKDRTTCILFGDGAAAVLLEGTTDDYGVIDAVLRSDGIGAEFLHIKAGGSKFPSTSDTVEKNQHYLYQDGSTVFKYAVKNMADAASQLLERNNLAVDDITWLVPHQANKRIIDATAERMAVPSEKIMYNVHKYGNTTAATIPLCLWDYESQLKKGDNLILAAFGGGFTWGAVYVKWAY